MADSRRSKTPARLTMRMYNIGFGDSFLLTSASGPRTWRMLVDCGVHAHGASDHHVDQIVGDIIALCTDSDGTPRIDVVVATHRHRDHISGFADERWQQVEVGEVWLPWTEDPTDELANELRATQDALALSLQLALEAEGDPNADLALNSLTNEDAMWTLRQGFAGDSVVRRYVVSDPSTPNELPGLPGGRVNFLGPGRDEKALRRMDPPSAERWLTLAPRSTSPQSEGSPFPSYEVSEVDYFALMRDDRLLVEASLRRKLAGASGPDALAAAAWLDRVLNNTSVVVLLRVGDASVLLPGDAQWGAWLPLLDAVDVRSLLSGVTVYKVSHHGSHNGTPRTLAEEVFGDAVTSVVSFRHIERWPHIPKSNLMEALMREHRQLLSSDGSLDRLPGARQSDDGLWWEFDIPT
jgi:beta-lactamase superfamily II metal-dependent hydrolase